MYTVEFVGHGGRVRKRTTVTGAEGLKEAEKDVAKERRVEELDISTSPPSKLMR